MASAVLLVSALALSPVVGGGFGEMTNGILQILVFGAVVLHLGLSGDARREIAKPPGLAALGLFAVVFVASVFGSEALYFSLKQLLFMAACFGAYFLAASLCRDARVVAAAVWAIAMSAMMVSVFGIRGYAIGTGGGAQFWKALLAPGDHWRLFGPFVNPGFFAGYLVVALPVTLGAYLVTRRAALAMLAGLGFVVQVIALLLTGTKFGIVCGVAGLMVFFVLAAGTGALRRAKFARLLVIAVVLLPLGMVFSKPVMSRISAAEAGGSQVHSTEFRIYTWQATVDMIRSNPWLGVGPGAYDTAYPRYTIAGPTRYAHQSYLQIAAESGAAALVAFVAVLAAIVWRSLAAMAGPAKSDDTRAGRASDEPVTATISWRDLVPFSARRVIACSLFAALIGSAARSLVDSDWYVLGIALPFWALAGMLVSQSGAVREYRELSKRWRTIVCIACAAFALTSASFGLGDFYAGRMQDAREHTGPDVAAAQIELYRRAVTVSPLNPKYRRDYGTYLAHPLGGDEPERGAREIERAIRLAPTDAQNYHARALVALWTGDLEGAVRYLRRALKFNPNSTRTILLLADTYAALDDERGRESALQQLLDIESTPYEQIKGTPEMVDTTFAYAHVYFGEKYLAQEKFARAAGHFDAAVERLERWRSNKQFLEVARYMGMLTTDEERALLMLQRDCYYRIADIRREMGNEAGSRIARSKGDAVQIPEN